VGVGVIETGIFLRLKAEGVFDQRWLDAALKNQCLKRFGQPEEIADAVLFLATAQFVTGQMLMVDGGYTV
jgi:NAD(P)-dependent dehydrogenase (short-subunit alcohol dehydrogenase family)